MMHLIIDSEREWREFYIINEPTVNEIGIGFFYKKKVLTQTDTSGLTIKKEVIVTSNNGGYMFMQHKVYNTFTLIDIEGEDENTNL